MAFLRNHLYLARISLRHHALWPKHLLNSLIVFKVLWQYKVQPCNLVQSLHDLFAFVLKARTAWMACSTQGACPLYACGECVHVLNRLLRTYEDFCYLVGLFCWVLLRVALMKVDTWFFAHSVQMRFSSTSLRTCFTVDPCQSLLENASLHAYMQVLCAVSCATKAYTCKSWPFVFDKPSA